MKPAFYNLKYNTIYNNNVVQKMFNILSHSVLAAEHLIEYHARYE